MASKITDRITGFHVPLLPRLRVPLLAASAQQWWASLATTPMHPRLLPKNPRCHLRAANEVSECASGASAIDTRSPRSRLVSNASSAPERVVIAPRHSTFSRFLLFLLSLLSRSLFPLLLSALPACSSPAYRANPSFTTGESIITTGDWNDVRASVGVGAAQCQMAVVTENAPSPDELAFDLVTTGDDRATLRAVRKSTASAGPTRGPDGPVAIQLTAAVGLFGDRAAERRLLECVRARLSKLAGVDTAPVK